MNVRSASCSRLLSVSPAFAFAAADTIATAVSLASFGGPSFWESAHGTRQPTKFCHQSSSSHQNRRRSRLIYGPPLLGPLSCPQTRTICLLSSGFRPEPPK
jgi:hypothetical protein